MTNDYYTPDIPRKAFFNLLQPYAYCDVLIDRLFARSLDLDVPELKDDTLEKEIVYDRYYADKQDQTPILIRIPSDQLDILDRILDYAIQEVLAGDTTRAVCGFLLGASKLNALGIHLSQHIDPQFEDGGSLFFRFYDPRVLQQLPRILTQQQLHALLEPMDTWVSINWHGEIYSLNRPQALQTISYGKPSYTALQKAQIQRLEAINRTCWRLLKLRWEVPEAEVIEPLVIEAASKNLNADDQVAYAVFAFIYEEKFTRHEKLNDFIQLAVRDGTPFRELIEQLLLPEIDPSLAEPNE